MLQTIASNPNTVTRRTDVRPEVSVRPGDEIDAIARAGAVVHDVLESLRLDVKPGISTADLADRACGIISESGAEALPLECLDEDGIAFGHAICTSVDDVVLHGAPDSTSLVAGQVLSIDCSVRLDGWCADGAISVPVGEVDSEIHRMIATCDALLETAIDLIRPGLRWSRIARVMQELALDAGFGVVEEFGGHGIGRSLHELPEVPSTMTSKLRGGGGDFTLRPGMVLAIEPTLVLPGAISGPARDREGDACGVPVVTDPDGWAIRTIDGSPAVHAEHTVAVGHADARVLTQELRFSSLHGAEPRRFSSL